MRSSHSELGRPVLKAAKTAIALSAVLKGDDVAENRFLCYFFEYSCFAGKLKW